MDRRSFLMSSAAALGAASSTFGAARTTRSASLASASAAAARTTSAATASSTTWRSRRICDIDDVAHRQRPEAARRSSANPSRRRTKTYASSSRDKYIDAISISTPEPLAHPDGDLGHAGRQGRLRREAVLAQYLRGEADRRRRPQVQPHGASRAARSAPRRRVQEAVQKMRDGLIGDVYLSRGLCFKWRDTIGRKPVEPVPAGVDYDLWTGPAPMHQFTKNRFHYNWHWFWDTGNGDLGNQGIHEVDIARWGLGVKYPDQGQRDRRPLHVRRRPGDAEHPQLRLRVQRERQAQDDGIRSAPLDDERRSHGSRARQSTPSATCSTARRATWRWIATARTRAGSARRSKGRGGSTWEEKPGPEGKAGGDHYLNFIEAVRSREARTPERRDRGRRHLDHPGSPGEHLVPRSAARCTSTQTTYSVKGDPEANKLFTREYRKPSWFPRKSSRSAIGRDDRYGRPLRLQLFLREVHLDLRPFLQIQSGPSA